MSPQHVRTNLDSGLELIPLVGLVCAHMPTDAQGLLTGERNLKEKFAQGISTVTSETGNSIHMGINRFRAFGVAVLMSSDYLILSDFAIIMEKPYQHRRTMTRP